MIFRIILAILSFCSFTALSQEMDWSVSQKVEGRMVYTDILGAYQDNYYVVKYDKKNRQSFKIEKYNKHLNPSGNYEFKAEKNQSIEKIMLAEGFVQIFKSYYDKEDKHIKLEVTVLNTGLVPVIRNRTIGSTNMNNGDSRVFNIAYDPYNALLVVVFPVNKKDSLYYYEIKTYDKLLYQKSKQVLSLAHSDDFSIRNVGLYDQILTAVVRSNYNRKNRIKKYVFSFLKYDIGDNRLVIIDLFDKNYKSAYPQYSYNKLSEEFLISSFFTDYSQEGLLGIEYLKICKTCDTAFYNRILFSQELINKLLGKDNKSGELRNYKLREVVMRNDGGILIVGEYFSVQREFYNDYYAINSNYVKYFYRYSDLVLFSINSSGKIDWTKVIRKEQVSMNDDGYYSSFLVGAVRNKMLLLYNDLSRSNWNLVSNYINPDGEIKSDILVNQSSFDGFLIPKIGKQVKENEILVPGFDRKKGFVLLKISM